MKKKIALIASLGLSLIFSSNVFAASTFTDIGSSYAKNEIQQLANDGILAGDGNNKFRPTDKITRQEFAVILAKSLELENDPDASARFTDVDSWARPYVGALYSAGITSGTGPHTFGAKNNLSREDLAVFYVRAMQFEEGANSLYGEGYIENTFVDADSISPYAKGDVAMAKEIGFVKGSNNRFNPKDPSERQAVARLAYEFIYHYDSVYIPNFIKVQMHEATACALNEEDGTFGATLTNRAGLIKQAINFSYEEAIYGSPFAYQAYRDVLANGNFYTFWVDNADSKSAIAEIILTSWALDDSGVTLDPATYASNDAMEATMVKLIEGIDAYKNAHPSQAPTENDLITVGINQGILVGNK